MRGSIVMALLMTLLLAAPSRGDERLKDLVNGSTVLVARLDLERLDVAALRVWVDAQLAAQPQKLDATKVEGFRRDLGPLFDRAASHRATLLAMQVKQVYVVGYLAFMEWPVRLVLVHDGDAEAVKRYVESLGLEATVEPGRVVGTTKQLAVMLGGSALPNPPDLLPLLQRSEAPMVVVVGLGDESRSIFEDSGATLPKDWGEAPVTVLTRGVRMAMLEVSLPPRPSAGVTIASQDAESARALRDWLQGRFAALREQEQVDLSMLLPEQREASLVRALDEPALQRLASLLMPTVLGAREQATNARVMSGQRQLIVAVVMYAVDRQGAWPESLDQAARATQMDRSVLVNPRRPDLGDKGFVYVRPGESMNDLREPAKRLVIYEAHDAFPPDGLGVAFADGHAEWITSPDAFAELKRAAEAAQAK